jgi:uncharacterized protein
LLLVLKNGTIVPEMGTIDSNNPVASALFSKNRRAILALLFGHPDRQFYLRQISRACGGGLGAIQRELGQLVNAGIIEREVRDKQVYFKASENCPVFEELKGLVVKTAGVADVLRISLAPLSDNIILAFVYGSVARGSHKRQSDIDLIIVGNVSFAIVVQSLAGAQESLSREVNPVVYSPKEFQSKITAGRHFLSSVMKKEKIFIIGDDNELERLAAKRLAD